MCIAVVAAALASLIVPPDAAYLTYFDFKTLSCLFCTLAVVCALKNTRFFTILAQRIVTLTGNLRSAVLSLVVITFIGSMLTANDMALLTFLPLGYFVLEQTGRQKHMAFVFIMQNIAANLGGMLTPFGNPQNLYLYSRFAIPSGEFVAIMAPPFALSVALIVVCCLVFVPSAILLSQFTSDYKALLLGVNIGGAGTLIASLANLITFREYLSHNAGGARTYILRFSAFNFAFLGILIAFCLWLLA